MSQQDPPADWLGDLNWRGYPRLSPVPDVAGAAAEEPAPRRPRAVSDVRAQALAQENEQLRAKIADLSRLASEFERRLSEAASSYEKAALESDSVRQAAELENSRLSGELESVRSELARREARELAREAELKIERERRADREAALIDAKRRLNDLEAELVAARAKSAELAGTLAELRRAQEKR